jgi:histidinol-phosphate aminotransferase
MSRFWSRGVDGLTPYVPGEQPRQTRLVKLNTNECPYPPSPRVLQAVQGVTGDDLRRYPDPVSSGLCEAAARFYGVQAEEVFVGNGSDEVLAHVFRGLLKQDQPLLFPDITYSFYPVWCQLFDIEWQAVPLAEDFTLPVAAFAQPNGGVIFPNPNAPTGIGLPLEAIRRVLIANPERVVVVDEAYVDFGAESATSLVADHDNLLVVQTLSKSRSLAGMRVGVAIGQRHLIEALERVKDSFNSYPLDVVAQRAATASFEDREYFSATIEKVCASRAWLTDALRERGFEVLPSQANFVFASHADHEASRLFEQLRERAVLVRYFSRPRIDRFLRISIGTDDECSALVAALDEILAGA